jgi:ABC-type bacteriocin/lantibiotic exporter with double-glycine peptidase domain
MPLFWHQRQGNLNCGPTCVAIIANATQREACEAMFSQRRPPKYCYSWDADIHRGLWEFNIGFSAQAQNAKSFSRIPTLAIVSVDDDEHWVVYSPRDHRVYDPEIPDSMLVEDYVNEYRKEIHHYIAVEYPRKRRAARRPRLIRE